MLQAFLLALLMQIPIVSNTYFLEWDDGNAGVPTETNIYVDRNAGVDPLVLAPYATVASGETEWQIAVSNGRWHVAVTAIDPVSGVESIASNEISFHVVGPPGNPRIRVGSVSTTGGGTLKVYSG